MDNKKIRAIGAAVLAVIWVTLVGFAWLSPAKAESEAERRALKQLPELNADTIISGKFMADFDGYTLDQFPLRDGFRQIKSLFHNYVMNYGDNNDLYITDGYIVKQESPLRQESVDHALSRFQNVYNKLLADKNCNIYASIVPDKGYYMGEESGHLTMDYASMFSQMENGMPWATYIDITDTLTADSYYRTDTHWRQEALLPTAQKLTQAMGAQQPVEANYTFTALERPFYGVYYGQAALPVAPETMYLLESQLLSQCRVMDYEMNKTVTVYDMAKLQGKDMYEVYLSGSKGLLTIENPSGEAGKELIIFRDSFGSSIAPLLVNGYSKVTLVDIRYMMPDIVGRFVDFQGKDVLFLYSTLVLNNSETIK